MIRGWLRARGCCRPCTRKLSLPLHTSLYELRPSPQWYLDPESMRLPRPAVPEGLAPPQRAIMEALSVRAPGGLRREG